MEMNQTIGKPLLTLLLDRSAVLVISGYGTIPNHTFVEIIYIPTYGRLKKCHGYLTGNLNRSVAVAAAPQEGSFRGTQLVEAQGTLGRQHLAALQLVASR